MGPEFNLQRAVLDNGLRVLVVEDSSAPAVAVTVHYGVGWRDERPGRTGFAHLFEHLMFAGSANVGKAEHAQLIQAAGGSFNGQTLPDYTDYHQVLPSPALELALFLEADRMRSVRLDRAALDNQVAVVKEEIRVNVDNQPYGGFPWLLLPPVLYSSFANSHNGYGDFTDLESASVDDARSFFDRYYAPGNALLTVAGDATPAEVLALVERHFGDIPARVAPVPIDLSEPAPDGERRARQRDAQAPAPALALGWRVPDPVADLRAYLPYVLLSGVLGSGDASRLQRRLVLRDGLCTMLSVYLGLFGDAYTMRDPLALQVVAYQADGVPAQAVLEAVDAELDLLAREGPAPDELRRAGSDAIARVYAGLDSLLGRARALGAFELVHGRAELLSELADLLRAVQADEVHAAARRLVGSGRALLELEAGEGAHPPRPPMQPADARPSPDQA